MDDWLHEEGLGRGKLEEVGSEGNSLHDNGEDKEHKGKKTIQKRRKRKPWEHEYNCANAVRQAPFLGPKPHKNGD